MRADEYAEANRLAWDQAAPVHAASQLERLREAFSRPGHSCLDPTATAALEAAGVRGRVVAQLCCNNGRELLSTLSLGAACGVGFDISEPFLAQARELSRAAGREGQCRWVEGDVLRLPADHDGAFELVFTTVGVLGWMPDLEAFFAVVRRLLRPGGRYVAYEMHPVCDLFEPGDPEPGRMRHGYFRTEPFVDTGGLDYYSGSTYASAPSYWFHHKLSDVVNACLGSGLRLLRLEEHPQDISGVCGALVGKVPLPFSYTLTAS